MLLRERVGPGAGNVDRALGVIRHVKLLGFESKKGRTYPREVVAKAMHLYEGIPVNVDHVDPGERRSLRDRIGLIQNVVLEEDGLYGDFFVNRKHELAEQIFEDAERAPRNLGFSHDTRGSTRNIGGKAVVESIDKVLSVDLVANPATTGGLFEGEGFEPGPFAWLRESQSLKTARVRKTIEKYTQPTSDSELLPPAEPIQEDQAAAVAARVRPPIPPWDTPITHRIRRFIQQ